MWIHNVIWHDNIKENFLDDAKKLWTWKYGRYQLPTIDW